MKAVVLHITIILYYFQNFLKFLVLANCRLWKNFKYVLQRAKIKDKTRVKWHKTCTIKLLVQRSLLSDASVFLSHISHFIIKKTLIPKWVALIKTWTTGYIQKGKFVVCEHAHNIQDASHKAIHNCVNVEENVALLRANHLGFIVVRFSTNQIIYQCEAVQSYTVLNANYGNQ